MKEILLALILAGTTLHISVASKQDEKDSEVRHKGPVVYTNLPPPVLYFPNFPERPKFSNRGSEGDAEDKRIEYVPFPYKDLPLLVYQSQNQPPVHVVEQKSNSMTDDSSQHNSGYQTGPAVYRVANNDQYGSENSDTSRNPPAITSGIVSTPSQKFINVGLSTTSVPSDQQNQQYISIGLTSIQSQGNELHGQSESLLQGSNHVQQTNNAYNQMQYSGNQNMENSDYSSNNADSVDQGDSAYVYYTNQYSDQNTESKAQIPVEQLTQAIQTYLLQQVQSGEQQTLASYPNAQDSLSTSAENIPTQHVGITIIRQPESPTHGNNEPQYNPPPSQPSTVRLPPVQNNQGYENNQQQIVSIGVYPINVPGNEYAQDPQQYYNVISSVSNDQYQNANEDYDQANQNYENPPPPSSPSHSSPSSPPPPPPPPPSSQNDNAQTTGYQVISIDLSALKKQNLAQQMSPAPAYPQPIQRPPPPPVQPSQNYRPTNENDNSYNTREKEFQQIVIQIPNTILSEQSDRPQNGGGMYETPYTGKAQVSNVMRDSIKTPNGPASFNGPNQNRPVPQKPPPNMHHSERPLNPKEPFGFSQNGVLSNGINIAIIKQTDSSNNSPMYQNFHQRPPPLRSPVRPPTHPKANKIPYTYPYLPHRPMLRNPNRPVSPKHIRYNNGHDIPNFGGHRYPASETRYHSQRHFDQYKSKPRVPQLGGHPGIYSSSNHHYTSVNPTVRKPHYYSNAFPMNQPITSTSATKTQAQFVSSPILHSVSPSATSTDMVEHVLTNNIGGINFDEINAFLSPNYDLFGSLTNGPDKKKVVEETKLLQKVTSDLLTHDLNAPSLMPPVPAYGIMKPPPQIINAPFPYRFWEQPMLPPGNMIPPRFVPGNDHMRLMNYYSHMRPPYAAGNRPFNPLNNGNGRKRGLGKGRLRKKLSALRTSIRHKSKIAPRQEETDEISDATSDEFTDASMYEIAAPRSTIIKREGPGLDGITIPLRPEHMLLSRISLKNTEEEDEEDEVSLPPIIVYKGSKPPIEIYGSKSDIEQASNKNETQNPTHTDKKLSPENASAEQPKDLDSQESVQFYSSQEGGYIDYMYSMLPDLIQDTFHRRLDSNSDKWLPVSSMQYAVAEGTYDTNKTMVQEIPPSTHETVKEAITPQNSSFNAQQSSIEETVQELFSLMGKDEISDLVKA